MQPGAGDGVERAERFVHEQHARFGGQRAGQSDSLLLPAGELGRIAAAEFGRRQADQIEQHVDPLVDLLFAPTK